MTRPIRYGMVGGGPDAFIGAVHRRAARLDGEWTLVAGAFSSDATRSRAHGASLGLDPSRAYGSWVAMLEGEAWLPADRRMEAVVIVTPNHLHFPIALGALEAGFDVVCDKPLTTTLADAEALVTRSRALDRVFCVTHNYTGYPMVKEARERVAAGDLGDVRRVVVEYTQGWLRTLLEAEGQKQATWRGDPERAGPSSALGDIGSHAHNLAGYVTGLEPTELFADLGTVVPGRALEDDGTVLLRYAGGARGLLTASQISTGERNHLRLRVYGSEGALDWLQERPDRLRLVAPSGVETILYDGVEGLSPRAAAHLRLPGGHPEGFIEAFANLYRNVARTLRTRRDGGGGGPFDDDFPTVEDGARGVHFIETAVASAAAGRWLDAGWSPP
ncbi:MAG: Gfo/Idh/MocA family oxidoreductase [Gemmatimonadetes bacterium]|nr:Gfo/Idh/MocA family oxidoreductase [Gemmatimonadota bacterium]